MLKNLKITKQRVVLASGRSTMYGSVPIPTHMVLCHVQVSANTHTKGSVPCTDQHQHPHKGFCAMYRSAPTLCTGQCQHPHKYTGQYQHPHKGFCAMYRSVPTPTQRVLCQVLTLTSQNYGLLVSMSPGCCSGIVRETSLMPSCPWRGTGWQDLRPWGKGEWLHNTTLSPAE